MTTIDNGVNVQALLDAREVLAGAPEAAQFTWRASSRWENGVHSTTTIKNFFGLGEEQSHKTEAVFDADHPEVFAATDNGITPIEYLLVGPGELPDGRRRVGRPESRDPAALGRVDGRGQPRHPRDPRRRQRRPERLQRHQGDVRDRRRRLEAGDRSARRPVPEALRGVRRPHESDGGHRRGRLTGLAIERFTTVVIGAGHAGLAASHFLSERSIDHVVLERGEVANSWRYERWDSLRLLTPNWQSRLPGLRLRRRGSRRLHDGRRSGRAHHSVRRACRALRFGRTRTSPRCGAPTTATGSRRATARSSRGRCSSQAEPAIGRRCRHSQHALPPDVEQLTPFEYRNPTQLPDGGVLVVGASATGVQLAAELRQSGRPVILSVGEHVRLPRTYRGRDVLWWMDASGVWDQRYDEVDDLQRARRLPSPQLVGTPERTTLDLNALTAMGVELVGRWAAVRDGRALFSGGLRNVCSLADLKMERLLDAFDEWARTAGADAEVGAPERFAPTEVPAVDEAGARPPQRRDPSGRLGDGVRARLPVARRAGRRREGPAPPRRRRRRQPGPVRARACPCCGGASPRSSTASRTTRAR